MRSETANDYDKRRLERSTKRRAERTQRRIYATAGQTPEQEARTIAFLALCEAFDDGAWSSVAYLARTVCELALSAKDEAIPDERVIPALIAWLVKTHAAALVSALEGAGFEVRAGRPTRPRYTTSAIEMLAQVEGALPELRAAAAEEEAQAAKGARQ